MTNRRATAIVSFAASVVLSLTACGSTDVSEDTHPVSSDDLFLPIDAYALTFDEGSLISHARNILVDECTSRLGFETNYAEYSANQTNEDFGRYGNRRRYGITRTDIASRYGYHLATDVDHAASDQQGLPAEAYGCLGEADARLFGATQQSEADLTARISRDSYQASLTDPAVTEAFAAWSRCMAGKGHDYRSPLDVASDFDIDNQPVTPPEVATAQADVACKQRTRLVETWHGFEVRHQTAEISEHTQELQTIRDQHDDIVDRANQVIRES